MSRQFVCVRIQSMNGVNLGLFQFDFDLTWMSFFMDAQNRFYTRYGGRADSGPESHLNKESLLRVMGQVLDLHKAGRVQSNRYEPTGRKVSTPEQIPSMLPMLAGRENKCIHCHDVKVAMLKGLRKRKQLVRDMVYTYPTPGRVGIVVDPKRQDHIQAVRPRSIAARAGLRPGDRLVSSQGHRILTLADFSRKLELVPREANQSLPLEVERDGRRVTTQLVIPGNFRKTPDPSWRESLHVVGPNCGLWGRRLNPTERKRLKLPAGKLALKVGFIWGSYTRRAGIRVGDIIVRLDGKTNDMTIQQLHGHSMINRNWGDTIAVTYRRGGREITTKITLPHEPTD